ncbi:hypothetical protein Tco_0191710, partial [Tanacetum coccineum]
MWSQVCFFLMITTLVFSLIRVLKRVLYLLRLQIALNTSYEIELANGKIVHIPLLNDEILEVQGERPEKDFGSLACIKADEKKLDDIRV